MKKIIYSVMFLILTLTLYANSANAWDLCFKDPQYDAEWNFSIEGNRIIGQVTGDSIYLPAAMTGVVETGKAFFAIDYTDNYGLRFYNITISNMSGTTWGVSSVTGEYYDTPHSASVVPCSRSTTHKVEGNTGADE